jgi:hypothetical protein
MVTRVFAIVARLAPTCGLALVVSVAAASLDARPALALLNQTSSDLALLEDLLTQRLESEPGLRERVTPLLVAPPVHHWVESRGDFAAAANRVLATAFPTPGALIACEDCDTWRLHVQEGASLSIVNGELSLAELARIRQDPRYGGAKALVHVEETPAGVSLRLIELVDGRVLVTLLADSTERLSEVRPYLHYGEERERRLNGESLSYVFINLGLWPKGLFQTEFVEQWGDRNQYVTGVGLSFFNPTFALGVVYHYMIPSLRQLQVVGSLYYPLQNALGSAVDRSKNDDLASKFVVQAMTEYAFTGSFAVFASLSTEGNLSLGVNLYNPLFMPFLL